MSCSGVPITSCFGVYVYVRTLGFLMCVDKLTVVNTVCGVYREGFVWLTWTGIRFLGVIVYAAVRRLRRVRHHALWRGLHGQQCIVRRVLPVLYQSGGRDLAGRRSYWRCEEAWRQ